MGFWERTWLKFAEPFVFSGDGDGAQDIPMRTVAYLFVALFKSTGVFVLFVAIAVFLHQRGDLPAAVVAVGLVVVLLMIVGYFRAALVRRTVELRDGRIALIWRSAGGGAVAWTDIRDFTSVAYRRVVRQGRYNPSYNVVELRHADARKSVPLSIVEGEDYPFDLIQGYARAFDLPVLDREGRRIEPAMVTANLRERAALDDLSADYDPQVPEDIVLDAGEAEIVVDLPGVFRFWMVTAVVVVGGLLFGEWAKAGFEALPRIVGIFAFLFAVPLGAFAYYGWVTAGGRRRLRLTPESVTFAMHRADVGWETEWSVPMDRIAEVSSVLSTVTIRTTDWKAYQIFFGVRPDRARWLKKYLVAAVLTAKQREQETA